MICIVKQRLLKKGDFMKTQYRIQTETKSRWGWESYTTDKEVAWTRYQRVLNDKRLVIVSLTKENVYKDGRIVAKCLAKKIK